jgi:plasmid stability protein
MTAMAHEVKIRDLDPQTYQRLKIRAEENGRSIFIVLQFSN